jgi:hypothetical protein
LRVVGALLTGLKADLQSDSLVSVRLEADPGLVRLWSGLTVRSGPVRFAAVPEGLRWSSG